MGLDMYLYIRGGTNIDTGEQLQDEEIGYWRKFNALHALFLEIGGAEPDSNCEEIDLTLENLEYIYSICKKVKDILDKAPKYAIINGEECKIDTQPKPYGDDYYFSDETDAQVREILPPCDGFFWGDLDIDDHYHYKLIQTLPILENAIELAKQGEQVYYYCWW